MDEKGKGEEVKELSSRPLIYPDLRFVYDAFVIIKSYCRDRPIRVGDILSYCDLHYLDDFYERKKLLRYIKSLEDFMTKHLKGKKTVGK